MKKPIYLDYASTTPTDPLVVQAMTPFFFESFGNASSPHSIGQKARKALEDSRAVLANFIGAKPSEIVFTSGASEGNNQAILTLALSLFGKGRHVIISAIEHHSVLECAKRLGKLGFQVDLVKPQPDGIVDSASMIQLIREDTILIALHHANNEIGVIQPVEEIGVVARQKGICFLVDATQTVGHIPVDVKKISCDLLSLSAHKFYGPQGVGALYAREGIHLEPRLYGGDQETGRRAGTQNLPGIVGLGQAIELCQKKMEKEAREQAALRDYMIEFVLTNIKGSSLNGHRQMRLPNNAHFSFEKINGEELVTALDMAGIAISQGSACKWGTLEPSHALKALGLSDELALGSLRVSIGRWTSKEDVDCFLEQLKSVIEKLRK
ncbi:MAG: cysteine desulfurase [Candidatus Omnitrophica bacterium]|nr:cysteine desulfurase [Candidatus Omnitrophota bacterium]